MTSLTIIYWLISRSPRFLGQLTHAQTVYTRPSFSIESGLESRLVYYTSTCTATSSTEGVGFAKKKVLNYNYVLANEPGIVRTLSTQQGTICFYYHSTHEYNGIIPNIQTWGQWITMSMPHWVNTNQAACTQSIKYVHKWIQELARKWLVWDY